MNPAVFYVEAACIFPLPEDTGHFLKFVFFGPLLVALNVFVAGNCHSRVRGAAVRLAYGLSDIGVFGFKRVDFFPFFHKITSWL